MLSSLSPTSARATVQPTRLLQARGTKLRKSKMNPLCTIVMSLICIGAVIILLWLRLTAAPALVLLSELDPQGILRGQQQQQTQIIDGRNLPVFVKPPPPVVSDPALTLAQVNQYAGNTILGSFRYQESQECQAANSNCLVHFPMVDLSESSGVDMGSKLPSDLGVLTMKGNKAMGGETTGIPMMPPNQDRVLVLSPLQITSPQNAGGTHDNHQHDFLLGLYDGHGSLGHGTSQFSAMELPTILLPKLAAGVMSKDQVKSAVHDSFLELDKRLPSMPQSGSTAIAILRIGDNVYIASTGDSHAFLARARSIGNNVQVTILKSTTPHKADMPEETQRILKAGGEIMPKMWNSPTSRVVIPIETDSHGNPLLMPQAQALAMSRSIGDDEGKKLGYLIPDPNVEVIDLKSLHEEKQSSGQGFVDHYFVVAASDGLFDKILPNEVALKVGQSFFQNSASRAMMICQELIREAARGWDSAPGPKYRDDISIAVKRVDL